ncbi:MAG: hypothetical protein QXL47_00250 [Candidatus Anstonellales archaeon]
MFVFQVQVGERKKPELHKLDENIKKLITDRARDEGYIKPDGSLVRVEATYPQDNKKYCEYKFRLFPWEVIKIDGKSLEYCPITKTGFQFIDSISSDWWNATVDDVKHVSKILFGNELWGLYFHEGILENMPSDDLPSPHEVYNHYICKGCPPHVAAGYAAHVNPATLAIQLLVNCAVEMAIGFGKEIEYPQKKLMYGFVDVLDKDAFGNKPTFGVSKFVINADFLNALKSTQQNIKDECKGTKTSEATAYLHPLVEAARNEAKKGNWDYFSRENVEGILKEKGWDDKEIGQYLNHAEAGYGSFNYQEWKELYSSFYSQFYNELDPKTISDPESVLLWMNPYYAALFYAMNNKYDYNKTINTAKFNFPPQKTQEELYRKLLKPFKDEIHKKKGELDKRAAPVPTGTSGNITVTAFGTTYTVDKEGIYKINDDRYFLVVRGAESYGVKELDISQLGEPEIKSISDYKAQLEKYKELLGLIEEFLTTGYVNPKSVNEALGGAGNLPPQEIRDAAKDIIDNDGKLTPDFWKKHNREDLYQKIREERKWVDSQLLLISQIERMVYMNLYVQSVQEFSMSDEFYNKDERGRPWAFLNMFLNIFPQFFNLFDFLKAGGAHEISQNFWNKYFKSSQTQIPAAITTNELAYKQRALRTYGEDLKKFYTDFYKLVVIKRTAWSINFFLSLNPNKPSTFAVQLNEKTWLTPTEIKAAGFMDDLSPFIIKKGRGFKVSKDLLCAFVFFGLMGFEDGKFELTKRGEELLKEWAKEKNITLEERSYIKYEISTGIMSDYGLDFLVFLRNHVIEEYAKENNISREEAIKRINEKNTQILSTSLDLLGKIYPLLPAVDRYTKTQVSMLVVEGDPQLSKMYLQTLSQLYYIRTFLT